MGLLKKIVSYPLSIIFYILFGLNLLLFDGIQRICLRVFGYQAHKNSVDIFNAFIVKSLLILGIPVFFNNKYPLPKNKPVLIVSNHQSLFDIPPIIWYLRKLHPKFISKKELGSGIPSVSYNLKYGGSILIDRKKAKESLEKMIEFSNYLNKNNRAGVIFPEGTRSRTGIPKAFHTKGLTTLLTHLDSEAVVLPITINNSWHLQKNGGFPMPLGNPLKFTVHKPIPIKTHPTDVLIAKIEDIIVQDVIT